jgi:hypothetical protein
MMPMCRGSVAEDEIRFKLSAMMMKRWTLAMAGLGLLLTVGCAKEGPEGPAPTVQPEPEQTTQRPLVTSAECQAGGGTIVNDIGDGAIHRPEYRCENGQSPTGTIRAESGEPIAIEGAVCCGPSPEPEMTDRPLVTSTQCQAGGGTIVGDIGDGAIHRPDYRCANGQPPTGTITAEQGEPIAVEGAVCCGS